MNEYNKEVLEILSQAENMLQTKEDKQTVSSLIDSINYTTDNLVSEVNDYYTNRGFLEKLLTRLKIKEIPERIYILKEEISRRSILN